MTGRRALEVDVRAMALRLTLLSSHYRSTLNYSADKLADAERTMRKWLAACEVDFSCPVPVAVVEALADDLNTPKAIAVMHGLRKGRRGRELFAAMRFLGLLGNTCTPDEIRLLPDDASAAGDFGPDPVASC